MGGRGNMTSLLGGRWGGLKGGCSKTGTAGEMKKFTSDADGCHMWVNSKEKSMHDFPHLPLHPKRVTSVFFCVSFLLH